MGAEAPKSFTSAGSFEGSGVEGCTPTSPSSALNLQLEAGVRKEPGRGKTHPVPPSPLPGTVFPLLPRAFPSPWKPRQYPAGGPPPSASSAFKEVFSRGSAPARSLCLAASSLTCLSSRVSPFLSLLHPFHLFLPLSSHPSPSLSTPLPLSLQLVYTVLNPQS